MKTRFKKLSPILNSFHSPCALSTNTICTWIKPSSHTMYFNWWYIFQNWDNAETCSVLVILKYIPSIKIHSVWRRFYPYTYCISPIHMAPWATLVFMMVLPSIKKFLQVEVPEVFKDVGGWRYSAATVRVQQAGLLPAWEKFAMLQQRRLVVPVPEFSELPRFFIVYQPPSQHTMKPIYYDIHSQHLQF